MAKITDAQAIAAKKALNEHGNKTKAAKALGLARSTYRDHLTAFEERGLAVPAASGKIIMIDDRCDKVRMRRVTEEEKTNFAMHYGMPWQGSDYIPVLDKKGRKVRDTTGTQIVLEGRELDIKTKRALRWMKNNPPGTGKRMPHHIEIGARALEEIARAAA